MLARVSHLALRFMGVLLFAATTSAQSQVTIDASKDNTLYEDAAGATSNGAGENCFVGRTNQVTGSTRRGLVAFNLAGRIPPGATITSVTLTLSMSRTISGGQTVSLHRVSADWGEGTSNAGGNEGSGAPATTNDATWLHRFFSTTLWSSAGGDFSATPSASQTVSGIGIYTWGSTAGMVSDIQQWLNTPSSNFGWVIIGNESAGGTSKRFDSRENITAANRPKLTVTFSTTDVDENLPFAFALHQNSPNPFNPTTTMRFELAARSHASLKIFNTLGQEVATLVNAILSPGAHTVQWNASDMSSGVYMYRLEAGGLIATKKLVLAR